MSERTFGNSLVIGAELVSQLGALGLLCRACFRGGWYGGWGPGPRPGPSPGTRAWSAWILATNLCSLGLRVWAPAAGDILTHCKELNRYGAPKTGWVNITLLFKMEAFSWKRFVCTWVENGPCDFFVRCSKICLGHGAIPCLVLLAPFLRCHNSQRLQLCTDYQLHAERVLNYQIWCICPIAHL